MEKRQPRITEPLPDLSREQFKETGLLPRLYHTVKVDGEFVYAGYNWGEAARVFLQEANKPGIKTVFHFVNHQVAAFIINTSFP